MNNKDSQQVMGTIAFILLIASMLAIMRLSSEGFWTGLSLITMVFSMLTLSTVAHSNDDNK